MPLQPVTRRSVPDEVFDQVLAEVVDGELEAGQTLPSERRLAEVLGVSRPAVREALQRMAQTRLVEVRQGGSTTVRDFRRTAGLDLLPRLLVRAGNLEQAETYAREFYGRRGESEALWVVPRTAIAEIGEFVDELERNYHRVDGYSLKEKLGKARELAAKSAGS